MKARMQLFIACILCLTLSWAFSGKTVIPTAYDHVSAKADAEDALWDVVKTRGQSDINYYVARQVKLREIEAERRRAQK